MTKNSRDQGNAPVVNFDSWAISRRDLLKITGLGLTALAGTNLAGFSTCTPAFAASDKEGQAVPGPPPWSAPKPNKPQYVLTNRRADVKPRPCQANRGHYCQWRASRPGNTGQGGRVPANSGGKPAKQARHHHSLAWTPGAGRHGRRPAHFPGTNSAELDIHLRISHSPKRNLLVPLSLCLSGANGVGWAIYHRCQK